MRDRITVARLAREHPRPHAGRDVLLPSANPFPEYAAGAGAVDDGSITTAKLGGDITTAGKALLDDADAAAQRTTLGLGTAATASTGAFDAAGAAAAAVAAHEGAGDPHLGYMLDTTTLDEIAAPVASVDINGQQMLSMRIENRTSDPGSPATGQIWLRTDL